MDMMVLVGTNFAINWNSFQNAVKQLDMIRRNQPLHDFGIGPEAAFTCPACCRLLPLHVAEVDHIESRASHQATIIHAFRTSFHRILMLHSQGNIGHLYKGKIDLTMKEITALGTLNRQKLSISLNDAAVIDMLNLQFIDGTCNRSKSDRPWAEAFPGRQATPLITSHYFSHLFDNLQPGEQV